jgi:hypothetical protein
MKQTLLFAIASLSGCTLQPFTYKDQKREIASLGGSILTKSKNQTSRIVQPDGTVIESSIEGKNETSVPVMQATTAFGEALLNKTPGIVDSIQRR